MSTILNECEPAGPAETAPAGPLPPAKPRGAEQELFWQNRELTAFHRISEVMLSGGSEQSVFDTIARETSEVRRGFLPVPAGMNLAQGLVFLQQNENQSAQLMPISLVRGR